MKTITIQVPDDCDVQIVKKESKFKKGDVIVSKCGLIAIYEKTEIREYDRKVVYYSTLYSPSYGKLKKINKVNFGIGCENDCHLATKEQKEILINALKTEAETNDDAKIVLKEVFNIEVEPVIRTYQDLIDNNVELKGFYIGVNSDLINSELFNFDKTVNTDNKNVAASEKVAKSMLAMAMISHLKPYYGGAITDKEWGNGDDIKFIIRREGNNIERISFYTVYSFLAFHTAEQRDNFLKYNEQLVKDYLMID